MSRKESRKTNSLLKRAVQTVFKSKRETKDEVNVKHGRANAWPAKRTIPNLVHVPGKFELTIEPNAFTYLTSWFIKNVHREIAGYFSFDNDIITWAVWCSSGSGGHVTTAEDDVMKAQQLLDNRNKRRADEGLGPIRFDGQWHTHPYLNPFWSGVDISDQQDTVMDLTDYDTSGQTYFIVFDRLDWLARKYWWFREDGKLVVKSLDGVVKILDTELTGKRYSYQQNNYSSGYNYQQQYHQNHQPQRPDNYSYGYNEYGYGYGYGANRHNSTPAVKPEPALGDKITIQPQTPSIKLPSNEEVFEFTRLNTKKTEDAEFICAWLIETFDASNQLEFDQIVIKLTDLQLTEVISFLRHMQRYDVASSVSNKWEKAVNSIIHKNTNSDLTQGKLL